MFEQIGTRSAGRQPKPRTFYSNLRPILLVGAIIGMAALAVANASPTGVRSGGRGRANVEPRRNVAPGVTRRYTSMTVFTQEIANARVWAGFHYRSSTRVGTDMGLRVGDYVAKK